MQHVFTWVATGLAVGWIARIAMKSRREFGPVGDLLTGLLGSLVGGWLFDHLGASRPDSLAGHVAVAIFGAMTLLGSLRILRELTQAARATPLASVSTLGSDLEAQVRRLSELERRIWTGVLGGRPTAQDPNQVFEDQLTFGERMADRVAGFGGSWTFIGLFLTILVGWMAVNTELARPFDAYPYILLNLVLSCVAALQAPIIMMSQNRQAAKDRLDARTDYEVNVRAELQIIALHEKLDAARERDWTALRRLIEEQTALLRSLEAGGAAARPRLGPQTD
ncbi:MAG: DUF1003 domain-containing protein [Vicinamibacterales bacterium]